MLQLIFYVQKIVFSYRQGGITPYSIQCYMFQSSSDEEGVLDLEAARRRLEEADTIDKEVSVL